MKEFANKLIGRLEEEKAMHTKFYRLSEYREFPEIKTRHELIMHNLNKTIDIVKELAEECKSRIMIDNEYCWQKCGATEHCKECSRLGNGTTDFYENYDSLAEEYNNGFCEWKLDGVYLLCQHNTELVISCLEEEKYRYTYCPYCGKKIKVVEE